MQSGQRLSHMKFPLNTQTEEKNLCVHANSHSPWTEKEDKNKNKLALGKKKTNTKHNNNNNNKPQQQQQRNKTRKTSCKITVKE